MFFAMDEVYSQAPGRKWRLNVPSTRGSYFGDFQTEFGEMNASVREHVFISQPSPKVVAVSVGLHLPFMMGDDFHPWDMSHPQRKWLLWAKHLRRGGDLFLAELVFGRFHLQMRPRIGLQYSYSGRIPRIFPFRMKRKVLNSATVVAFQRALEVPHGL